MVLRDGRGREYCMYIESIPMYVFMCVCVVVVAVHNMNHEKSIRPRIHTHAYIQWDKQTESKNKKNKTIRCYTISVKSVFLIATELSCVFYLLKRHRHLQTYREKKCECDCERKTERERKKSEWMKKIEGMKFKSIKLLLIRK